MYVLIKSKIMSKKLFISSIIISILALSSSITLPILLSKKIAFIDFMEVYNAFEYKIELEEEFNQIGTKQQQVIDSLKLAISLKQGSTDTSGLQRMKNSFNYNTQVFEHNNSILQEQYYEKIITQLNQYIYDFGDANQYDFIYGANGNGSVMYGGKGVNITDKVIEYINAKYEGK